MGYRRYAASITGPAVSDAAYAFRAHPTSDNWMKLERTMKAHQMSCFATEEELETFLEHTTREEAVDNLLILFDARMVALERDLEAGHIKLIKALPELRN